MIKPDIIIPAYLIVLNLLAFLLMGLDKAKARRHRWRIPEKALFLSAILGGSIGAIAGSCSGIKQSMPPFGSACPVF